MIGYCDGGCWPNPGGPVTWGWVIEEDDGSYVAHDSGVLPPAPNNSNNVAEYESLIQLLSHADSNDLPLREVRMDSKLIVKQASGRWACKAEHLKPMQRLASGLLITLGVRIRWIPREENESADALTREALADSEWADTDGREPESAGEPSVVGTTAGCGSGDGQP